MLVVLVVLIGLCFLYCFVRFYDFGRVVLVGLNFGDCVLIAVFIVCSVDCWCYACMFACCFDFDVVFKQL